MTVSVAPPATGTSPWKLTTKTVDGAPTQVEIHVERTDDAAWSNGPLVLRFAYVDSSGAARTSDLSIPDAKAADVITFGALAAARGWRVDQHDGGTARIRSLRGSQRAATDGTLVLRPDEVLGVAVPYALAGGVGMTALGGSWNATLAHDSPMGRCMFGALIRDEHTLFSWGGQTLKAAAGTSGSVVFPAAGGSCEGVAYSPGDTISADVELITDLGAAAVVRGTITARLAGTKLGEEIAVTQADDGTITVSNLASYSLHPIQIVLGGTCPGGLPAWAHGEWLPLPTVDGQIYTYENLAPAQSVTFRADDLRAAAGGFAACPDGAPHHVDQVAFYEMRSRKHTKSFALARPFDR